MADLFLMNYDQIFRSKYVEVFLSMLWLDTER
jgi:hypothetical protein